MKKVLMLLAVLAAGAPARATEIMTYKWDLDATTYTCPVVTARSVSRPVTTSGAASTTVTSVNSDAPFTGVAVGDAVVLPVVSATTAMRTGQEVRRVTAVASVDSITVDANVTIPSAGGTFVWLDLATGTGAEDGWFAWAPTGDGEVFIGLDQVSATGGIDYKIEGRQCVLAYCTPPIVLATDNLTGASAAESVARLATDKEFVDQVRACFKIGTADDDVVTITAATNDAIDFVELTNIVIVAGVNDMLDFVEDPAGAPDTCEVQLSPGSYTASALATHAQGRINTTASCSGAGPTNTYGVTWSAATRKFTVARTAGALAFDLPWLTGANAATSVAASMGYTADDTGAVSYLADAVTYSSAELTATLDAGLYATGTAVCAEVVEEMQAVAVASTVSCTYASATDKIAIAFAGVSGASILWNSGTNNATSADTPLGYAADSTGALSYLAPTALGLDASNEVEKISVTVRR